MSAGKGDTPRPVNGPVYRDNYSSINWKKKCKCCEKYRAREAALRTYDGKLK